MEITYDPAQVSYGQLLQIYFSVAHDPTQLNRQGPDTGTQYRSAVFPASDGQRQVAEAYIAQLNRAGVYGKPMATTIEPLKAFYRAEDYHQDYLVRHPYSMYIMVNDVPKVENRPRSSGALPGQASPGVSVTDAAAGALNARCRRPADWPRTGTKCASRFRRSSSRSGWNWRCRDARR